MEKLRSLVRRRRRWTVLTVMLGAFMFVGCGDGPPNRPFPTGPDDTDTKDDIPTTTSIPELSGLTSDAGQSYPLFYVSGNKDNGGLFSYDPATDTSTLIEEQLYLLYSTNFPFPLALHTATVTDGKISDFHVERVVYARSECTAIPVGNGEPDLMSCLPDTFQGMGVDDTTATQVTTVTPPITGRFVLPFNLANPLESIYAYPGDDAWKQISLGANATDPGQTFGAGLNVQRPVQETGDAVPGKTIGWIVIDENQNDCLAYVTQDDLTTATCIPNTSDGQFIKISSDNASGGLSGDYLLNEGMILAIPVPADEEEAGLTQTTEIWYYTYPDAGNPVGALTQVKNDEGTPLQTKSLGIFGAGQAGSAVSYHGDTLFLASDAGGIGGILGGGTTGVGDMAFHVYVFKITTEPTLKWETIFHEGGKLLEGKGATYGGFLVEADDQLILGINSALTALSLDGQTKSILDGRENDGSTLINGTFSLPVNVPSTTGWFYYNRTNDKVPYATAIQTDGSQRVELKGCQWIGTSTSGQGEAIGGSFASLTPSEVFMRCGTEVAAVSADDPLAGRVILGNVPADVDGVALESIGMGRTAPGPHRLMRVLYGDITDDQKLKVIYVNTQQEGSLKELASSDRADNRSSAFHTQPVQGF